MIKKLTALIDPIVLGISFGWLAMLSYFITWTEYFPNHISFWATPAFFVLDIACVFLLLYGKRWSKYPISNLFFHWSKINYSEITKEELLLDVIHINRNLLVMLGIATFVLYSSLLGYVFACN